MKKILIVDDDLEILDVIEQLLSDTYEIVKAFTVKEAMERCTGCTHALIDSMNGKGHDLARELKSMGIKTYLFSGFNQIPEGFEDAYCGRIIKPFDVEDIIRVIDG